MFNISSTLTIESAKLTFDFLGGSSLAQAILSMTLYTSYNLYKYFTKDINYFEYINIYKYHIDENELGFNNDIKKYLELIYLYYYNYSIMNNNDNDLKLFILKKNITLINTKNSSYYFIKKLYNEINNVDLNKCYDNAKDKVGTYSYYNDILIKDIHIFFNIENIIKLDKLLNQCIKENKDKKENKENNEENIDKYNMTYIINILLAIYDYTNYDDIIVDDLFITKTFIYMNTYCYNINTKERIQSYPFIKYLSTLNVFYDVFDNNNNNIVNDNGKILINILFNCICSIVLIGDVLYYIYDLYYDNEEKKYYYKMFCINIEDNKFYIDYERLNDITNVEFYKYKEYKMLDNLFIIFVRNLFKNDLFSKYVDFNSEKIDYSYALISNEKFLDLKQSKKIGIELT
jgi:hypothetical protein